MFHKERHGRDIERLHVTSYMSLAKLLNLAVPSFFHL